MEREYVLKVMVHDVEKEIDEDVKHDQEREYAWLYEEGDTKIDVKFAWRIKNIRFGLTHIHQCMLALYTQFCEKS